MTRGARGRGALSGARGREVLDGPRSRQVLEGGRSRQVLTGPRGRITGGVSYPDVLNEAVLWLDSQYSEAGEQVVVNRGSGGSALDAQYGSTTGADTNDPLLLTHTGENYVYPTTDKLNFLQLPAEAVPQGDDFEVRVDFEWRGDLATNQHRFQLPSGNLLDFAFNGMYRFFLRHTTGTDLTPFQATAASIEAVIGAERGRVQMRSTWTQADETVRTYARQPDADLLSDDGWSLIHSHAIPGVISGEFSVQPQVYGNFGGYGVNPDSNFYRLACHYGGMWSLDINSATDITDAGATSFTATSGQTVTVNRATSGRKTALVTRPIWLFGTDDFLEVADNALLDFGVGEWSVLIAFRVHSLANYAPLVTKRLGYNVPGWGLTVGGAPRILAEYRDVGVNSDVSSPPGSGAAVGDLAIYGWTRSGTENVVLVNDNEYPSTKAVINVDNTARLYVGRTLDGGSSYTDMECAAVAIWRRALTTDEIAAINSYHGTA